MQTHFLEKVISIELLGEVGDASSVFPGVVELKSGHD